MDELSDVALVEALRRQLTVAATKQTVAAGNLANANTPNFRAQEVSFDAVLDKGLAETTRPAATHPAHFQAEKAGVSLSETEGLEPKRDGNNVQLDRELLNMAEASAEFARAQTALSAKFRLVRYAINDGRR